jgi:heme/copper-type cytochrome/quinol oxidase subunit 2
MLQNIFQKNNFSTIIIVILLAFFLVFAIMRYRKVNEGMEENKKESTKIPTSSIQVAIPTTK